MRIGFMPVTTGDGGGIYQYSAALIDALNALRDDALAGDELVAVTDDGRSPIVEVLVADGWDRVDLVIPRLRASARRLLGGTPLWRVLASARRMRRGHGGQEAPDPVIVRKQARLSRLLRRRGIELMIYPRPSAAAFETDVPSVVAIHDLQHRLQPQFPEVSAGGEAAAREHLFRNIVRSALLILVDSEVGKEDVMTFYGDYGVHEDDIFVLPFVAPPEIRHRVPRDEVDRIREKYRLPQRYAFYPAAFWPHKNHARLIEALGELEATGDGVDLVMVGSVADKMRRETYEIAMAVAHERGVVHRLHHLGFVPEADMAPLFEGAHALLFPTFFGPTNIPVVEAWAHDVPVLSSDIRGIREQCRDAAVLVDPEDVTAIAQGVRKVWDDTEDRQRVIREGRSRLSEYGVEEHRALVAEMVREAKARLARGREDGWR